jgi:NAD(P)-dependent dehydrogenase (short-subunit alcohol dehydrogenase family)
MDLGLTGKIAFITGAAGGIGRELARLFAEEGMRVVAGDLDEKRTAETVSLVQQSGGDALALRIDVTDDASVQSAIAGATKHFGGIDVAVNAAGIYRIGKLADVPPDAWDQLMDINLRGTYLVCRAVLPAMLERGSGSIVNLASISGRTKSTLATPSYVASKAGVIGLTMALASQSAARGVRVNAVAPGPVDTDMIRGLPSELQPGLVATIPLGRLGTPREVASAIAFLASDVSAFITGETLNINGGAFMV